MRHASPIPQQLVPIRQICISFSRGGREQKRRLVGCDKICTASFELWHTMIPEVPTVIAITSVGESPLPSNYHRPTHGYICNNLTNEGAPVSAAYFVYIYIVNDLNNNVDQPFLTL